MLNVLKSLGLKNIENESGYIEVLNKIDLFDEAGRRYLEENAARNANVVPLSAVSGEGTERFCGWSKTSFQQASAWLKSQRTPPTAN